MRQFIQASALDEIIRSMPHLCTFDQKVTIKVNYPIIEFESKMNDEYGPRWRRLGKMMSDYRVIEYQEGEGLYLVQQLTNHDGAFVKLRGDGMFTRIKDVFEIGWNCFQQLNALRLRCKLECGKVSDEEEKIRRTLAFEQVA